MKKGDFFGEMELMTGAMRNASIITLEETETVVLAKQDFEALVMQGLFTDERHKEEFYRRLRLAMLY